MVNEVALREIKKLEELYKARWHKAVDLSLLPRFVSQERLCLILRRIIDTGESCLVEYEKIKEITMNYYSHIDWTIQYKNGDILNKKCPFCGKAVRISFFGAYEQSYVIHCDTDFCLRITLRGL